VVAGRDDLTEAYLAAIERELSWLQTPREVDTLFLGGGTPTHLAPEQLRRLLLLARRWFPLAPGYELSVEANPADLNQPTAAVLAECGVTRVSLGAQSFNSTKLYLLERDHRAEQITLAVAMARTFASSVSLDLIFGAPGETLDGWRDDLRAALALSPEHVSTYGLTFERGTAFWGRLQKGELRQADESLERAMYETAIDTLTSAGLAHYEVSNFARPGHRCRHNETYWSGRGYYAAGPGASRFIAGRRETNHKSTTTYLRHVLAGQSPVAEHEELPPEDAARERLVFALRRLEGIDCDEFARETGYTVDSLVGDVLPGLIKHGLLSRALGRLRLTGPGLFISDAIWPKFLR
jgi:oxygen-independent coproporphyrinogen-3 oxidase